ncbi:MAG: DUF3516 domain-containing protein, partial [Myxococcota bacterium]
HGLIISCLKSQGSDETEAPGYRGLAELIASSHEPEVHRGRHRREAASLFRSLTRAGLVEMLPAAEGGRRVQVSSDLQLGFSLHQTLSLYLVDAVAALDREAPDYALDVLAVAEAILENPTALLFQQERKAKGELIAQLKAERVPYEERMERIKNVTWPKPAEDFIRATFALFAEQHPWVGSDAVHPKGIARDLYESSSGFHDWVRRMEIARVEGVLLRYLNQVHNVLEHSVPEAFKNEELRDMIGFFRAMIARVDSSLLEAWENLVRPGKSAPIEREATTRAYDLTADARGLQARIRGELQQLVAALAAHRFEEAGTLLHPSCQPDWPEERFSEVLAPFREEYGEVIHDPRARQAHLCVIDEIAPRIFRVRQVLLDEQGDNFWAIEGEVDLRQDGNPADPLLRLRSIAP